MKSVKLALLLSALTAVLVPVWLVTQQNQDGASDADASALQSDETSSSAKTTAALSGFTTGTEDLPPSLQGTEVAGELEVEPDGHLKVTRAIRQLFDYFLSAIGEEPLELILKRIRTCIHHRLAAHPSAEAEAERLLDSYLAYKRGLSDLPKEQMKTDATFDLDVLHRQMQQIQTLRSQYFSADVIAAFFGEEDAYDRYNIARMKLLDNKNLASAQRARQLAALEDQLTEANRESLKVANQVKNLESMTSEWKKRGGSTQELRQIREALVGVAASDRLETLDKVNSDWDRRMDSWYSERAVVLSNTGLNSQDKQRQVETLRKSRFSEADRMRVESIEYINDSGLLESQSKK